MIYLEPIRFSRIKNTLSIPHWCFYSIFLKQLPSWLSMVNATLSPAGWACKKFFLMLESGYETKNCHISVLQTSHCCSLLVRLSIGKIHWEIKMSASYRWAFYIKKSGNNRSDLINLIWNVASEFRISLIKKMFQVLKFNKVTLRESHDIFKSKINVQLFSKLKYLIKSFIFTWKILVTEK